MGLRVKRYGPLSTMVVVGRLVGTFEPVLVIVTPDGPGEKSQRDDKYHRAEPACRKVGGQEWQGHEPVERKPGNDGKPPCKRWPNNDLSSVCRVVHGGTVNPRSLSTSPCTRPAPETVDLRCGGCGTYVERHKPALAGPTRSPRSWTYSITSSARASSVAGTSSPSALAVGRLMTSSNLVGCSTGRSAGFSPLRMRPV